MKPGKPKSGIISPWDIELLPFPSSHGANPGVARMAHRTGHKMSWLPPSSASGNLNPTAPHPFHELQVLLNPNFLPEQKDIPGSWHQGEELHLELFFSHSHFSASLENVAKLTVHYHWSHASW